MNPYQIDSESPYFFCLLDLYIDKRTINEFRFRGKIYNLCVKSELKEFRISVKNIVMFMNPDIALKFLKDEILNVLGSSLCDLPRHLKTVNTKYLQRLIEIGVHVESHGWNHKTISSFDNHELIRDMKISRDWLKRNFNVESRLYAVPFGFPDVPSIVKSDYEADFFLLDDKFESGRLASFSWNRIDITGQIRAVC